MWGRGDDFGLLEKFLRFLFQIDGGLDECVRDRKEDDLDELDADSL